MSVTNVDENVEIVVGAVKGKPVQVTVREANAIIATRRYRLIGVGARAMGVGDADNLDTPPGADEDEFNLRVVVYPNLVAATIAHEGFEQWPPTFEEFCNLPEDFWQKWQAAVARKNPGWYGPVNEDPKVLTGSTSGSLPG